ncbi:MAG: T9SS type A sorting domain-containing protein [Candidatus Neomarinimicrobiota bacterium]
MKKIALILISLAFALPIFAEFEYLFGQLVNARGGIEKCDNVKIKLYVNSQAKAFTYTNEKGAFSIGQNSSINTNNTLPHNFSLDSNYPNPFNKITSLPFEVNTPGTLKLNIYNIQGKKVRSLVQDHYSKGQYTLTWNGLDDKNQVCPQGLYFYVMQMKGQTDFKKMTLLSSDNIIASPITSIDLISPASDNIELKIESIHIKNRSFIQTFSELPTSLDLGNIPIQVYPYLKTMPDPLALFEGESGLDTLDIYFEQDFNLSSEDIDFDWEITPDSSVKIHYYKVSKGSADFSIQEVGEFKINTFKINFDVDPRPSIWPKKLRRIYVGKNYAREIKIDYAKGRVNISPFGSLPASLSLNGLKLEGSSQDTFSTLVYMDIIDDRNITCRDSVLIVSSRYENLTFNDYVIDLLEEYHRDGRYPYSWVSGYKGVTKDLYYQGRLIANANADSSQSTYCCGITFEIWYRAMMRLLDDMNMPENINNMKASNFSSFISKWFVQEKNGDGPGIALVDYGLGKKIDNMQDVKKGDFVQIWRTSGSGHSVIFINWTYNAEGDTTGMRYWSTQPSTQGVNYNIEYFSGYGGKVDKAHTHYSRGFKPEDFIVY